MKAPAALWVYHLFNFSQETQDGSFNRGLAQWQHYTGTLANSVAIQKAFGAYRGDKMNHVPLMFINGGGKKNWVQLEGFPSAEQVVKEYRDQVKG